MNFLIILHVLLRDTLPKTIPKTKSDLFCVLWLNRSGLYDFHDDAENKLFLLNMPLGQKQTSMIFIMPYHLEPLDRLEKLLTRKQVDTWISKMENRAVAISLPKISVEVSHNLQVNDRNSYPFADEDSQKRNLCLKQIHFLSFSRNTWLSWA